MWKHAVKVIIEQPLCWCWPPMVTHITYRVWVQA